MQAENDQRLIQCADDQAREDVVEGDDRVDPVGDETGEEHDDRPEDHEYEGRDDEDLQERNEHRLDDGGNPAFQPWLQTRCQPCRDDNRENRGRIGHAFPSGRQSDRNSEEVRIEHGFAQLGDDVVTFSLGIRHGDQGREAEHSAYDGDNDGIGAQAPGSGEADDDREEVEHRRRHRVDELICVRLVAHDLVVREKRQDSLEDSGGCEYADDRDHRSRDDADERAEAVFHPADERRRAFPLLFLGGVLAGTLGKLLDDGIVDLRHFRADDYLILTSRPGDVDDIGRFGHGGVIGQGLVFQVEAQAGDAVDDRADVVRAADSGDDVSSGGVEPRQSIVSRRSRSRPLSGGSRLVRRSRSRIGSRIRRRLRRGGFAPRSGLIRDFGASSGFARIDHPQSHLQRNQTGIGVGEDHDRGGALAFLQDGIQIHGADGLPDANPVAKARFQGERLALQLNSVDSQVKEHLQA